MNYGAVANRKFGIYPLGIYVRRQVANTTIYRVMAGNGYFGTIRGAKYQQKMNYFVPPSINNPEGEPYRTMLRAAVDYWKNVLTNEQKTAYNTRATKIGGLSGYNLFVKEALKGDYHMYVYRGDPDGMDFAKGALTLDAAWHDLDLSGIIPTTARAVLLRVTTRTTLAGKDFRLKKYGQTNDENLSVIRTQVADMAAKDNMIVATDQNQKIEYKGDNATWNTLNVLVCGWWT